MDHFKSTRMLLRCSVLVHQRALELRFSVKMECANSRTASHFVRTAFSKNSELRGTSQRFVSGDLLFSNFKSLFKFLSFLNKPKIRF